MRRYIGDVAALTVSALVACGGRTTSEVAVNRGADAALIDAGAPACGASPHTDGFCDGWGQMCSACGLALSPCEREHFDELCMADERLRSAAYVKGVTDCKVSWPGIGNTGLCGMGSALAPGEFCMDHALQAGRTAAVTDVATRYCGQCPFSVDYGTDCVERLTDMLTAYSWSDEVWATVAARCLPSADAGIACEVDFFSCADKVFADAHPAGPCGTQRSLYF